jgi:hypothetical protein
MIDCLFAGQEQMKQEMLAMMDANQARLEATQAETKTDREEMLARTDANQERMNESLREEIKSGQAEMRSTVCAIVGKMDASIAEMKDEQRETMACQVRTEACLDSKEPNPEDMESEVEHREVPTEEAAVKSSRTMKKWHRDRHLAPGRRGEPNELTRGGCRSRRKLAAACRKVSHRVWRKRNVFRNFRTQ